MYEKTKNVFRQRFLRFRAVTTKTKKSQNLALIGRDAIPHLKKKLTDAIFQNQIFPEI
jgi:hypothetical protein